MTVIELPDDQAAALRAKAAAAGMTLKDWLGQLAGVEEKAAGQHDHYIYGWPKREI